uniref:Farnesoic acid O-methyl transferase domain-containing protein n=1 Tax=Anopheles quadriannulatus TaxID=34691 RepID=A0A904A668_ANOQN
MASRSAPLLPLLVAAFSLLLPLACAQTGTNFPASEFAYGSFTSDLVICYSNTINSQSIRLTPVTRTFSFTPGTTQTIKYIQIMSPDLKKFYAQIANGGVGGTSTTSTDIVVSSVHGGYLNVAVRIYCLVTT